MGCCQTNSQNETQIQINTSQLYTINVIVQENNKLSNKNLKLTLNPEIQFDEFIRGVNQLILTKRIKDRYHEQIDYVLDNGKLLQQNDKCNLIHLGFRSNCTLFVKLKLKRIRIIQQQPTSQVINVNVKLIQNFQKANFDFSLTIDSEIPFNIFAEGLENQIFLPRIQLVQYEKTIQYELENGINLNQNDYRTLESLGFTNNCTLYAKLTFKGMFD